MNCAILAVGSLLWEKGPREVWRQRRIQLKKSQVVSVPIRYGRRALTRTNTFTTVLDPCSKGGQGVLVPCIRNIYCIGDLVDEAEALWRAERRKPAGEGISAEWGCVGALFHAEQLQAELIEAWISHFRLSATPIAPVDQEGILHIPWPRVADGTPADADIILATATRAEADRPTTSQIADAWIDQDRGEEHYFFQNVLHGIRTPDDFEIGTRISGRAPRWMDNNVYYSVLQQLQCEK